MEAVASRVSVRKHKGLLITIPHVRKHIGAISDLEKQRHKVHGMNIRAASTVEVAVLGVGYVRLVVWRIEVLTVPAGGEDDLKADATRTLDGGEALLLEMFADTAVADGPSSKIVSQVALAWVTSDHAETVGEGMDHVVVRAGAVASLAGQWYNCAQDRVKLAGSRWPCHQHYRWLGPPRSEQK